MEREEEVKTEGGRRKKKRDEEKKKRENSLLQGSSIKSAKSADSLEGMKKEKFLRLMTRHF